MYTVPWYMYNLTEDLLTKNAPSSTPWIKYNKVSSWIGKHFKHFFFLLGAFYSKMFKWGRQGAGTIPSLSEDLLFLFFNCKTHFGTNLCLCEVNIIIWGHQILCILKRVKILPKQLLSQKDLITVSWNHFLYDIIPKCGNVCSSERW